MRDTLEHLSPSDFPTIDRKATDTLQVNLGYRCNQQCLHCHVAAGPKRTEMMDAETADLVIAVLRERAIQTLDLTGGGRLRVDFDVPGGEDGTVRLWDPYTAEELLVIEAHEYGSSVDAVDFSADGSKLLTGGWDNTTKIWDVETGEQLLAIEAGHSEEEKGGGFTGVVAAGFSPDGSRFATAGVGGL